MSVFPSIIPDTSSGPGSGDVTFFTPGGRNGVTLEAAEVGPTWETNQQATLVAEFPLADLVSEFGTAWNMLGRWVSWYGGALPSFGGVVTGVSGDPQSGTAQVSCVDFTYYLDKQNLPNSNRVLTGYAGALAQVLCKYANVQWLSGFAVDNSGPLLSVQLTGQGLLGQLQQNAIDSDQDWNVDPALLLNWRERLGSDLTASVQLSEGIEIADFSPEWDATNIINDLTIVPSQENYAARFARRVIDDASVAMLDSRQDTYTVSDAVRPSVLESIGRKRVAASAALGKTASLDVVNANGCHNDLRVGDTISVVLPSVNVATSFEIIQIGYTLSDGVAILTGAIGA